MNINMFVVITCPQKIFPGLYAFSHSFSATPEPRQKPLTTPSPLSFYLLLYLSLSLAALFISSLKLMSLFHFACFTNAHLSRLYTVTLYHEPARWTVQHRKV